MKSGERLTQKEIARRLKMSQATVSRALADSPLLPEATKREVREKAAKLGYGPDPVLSSLNSYRQTKRPISRGSVIAWLGRSPKDILRNSEEWESIVFQAAQARAHELGYKLEYFWLNDPGSSLRALERVLWNRGIAGLIIGPQLRPHSRLNFEIARWSAVTVSKTLYHPRIDQISADHAQEMSTCLRMLRSYGFRRIGLMLSHIYDEKTYGLWQGRYLLEQSRKRIDQKLPVLICHETDREAMRRWFERYRPEAVITAFEGTDQRLAAIKRLGFRVPEEIGVAFLNLRRSAKYASYTGIEEPNSEIGTCAIEVLVNRIRHNLRGVPTNRLVHLLEGLWVDGQTAVRRH